MDFARGQNYFGEGVLPTRIPPKVSTYLAKSIEFYYLYTVCTDKVIFFVSCKFHGNFNKFKVY